MKADNPKTRNSNIELLRLLLILGVILLHFNNSEMGGAFSLVQSGLSKHFLYFLEGLSICSVNCFMIISGYFLLENKEVKLSKVLDLLLTVIFYRFLSFTVNFFLTKDFSLKSLIWSFVPANYFALFYVVCYLFSPFLSLLFSKLDNQKSTLFTGLLFVLFIIYPTICDLAQSVVNYDFSGISIISLQGNGNGYTLIQFLTSFIIGMYLRKTSFSFRKKNLVLIFILSSLIIAIVSQKYSCFLNYCCVFNVINAAAIFLFFNQLHFQNKAINFMAKSVFPIFCIHTSSYAILFWKKYFITENHISSSFGSLLLWTLISVISMFLFSLIVDIVVKLIFGKAKKILLKKLPVLYTIAKE